MSPDMVGWLPGRLGQAALVAEIPAAGHHVLLDEPLSLVTALRTILASWAASEPGGRSADDDAAADDARE
jgi:hypothetical protein